MVRCAYVPEGQPLEHEEEAPTQQQPVARAAAADPDRGGVVREPGGGAGDRGRVAGGQGDGFEAHSKRGSEAQSAWREAQQKRLTTDDRLPLLSSTSS